MNSIKYNIDKRLTTLGRVVLNHSTHIEGLIPVLKKLALNIRIKTITPVSYTHLTLPTNREV